MLQNHKTSEIHESDYNLNSVFKRDPAVPGVIAKMSELINQQIVSAFCLFLSVELIKYLTRGLQAAHSHYPAWIISLPLK